MLVTASLMEGFGSRSVTEQAECPCCRLSHRGASIVSQGLDQRWHRVSVAQLPQAGRGAARSASTSDASGVCIFSSACTAARRILFWWSPSATDRVAKSPTAAAAFTSFFVSSLTSQYPLGGLIPKGPGTVHGHPPARVVLQNQ
jgi:hypothetical protein